MQVKSVKYNFIMKSLMAGMMVLVPLLVYPYVSRVIRPEGIGAVNFAQNVIVYFTMIAQLGIPTYGIREVAKVRDDKALLSRTVLEILTIHLIMCAVSLALFFLCLFTVPQMKEDRTLFLVMALPILLNSIGAEWMYSGLEQYGFMAKVSIAFNLLMVALVFLFVKEPQDYVIYGAAYVLGTSGAKLVYFLSLHRVIDCRSVGSLQLHRHLKPIAVFFMMAVATTIYTSMDSVMLGFMRGTLENGYYDAAVKVKMVLVSLITTLGTVLLPRSSYLLQQGDRKGFESMSARALNFVILISLPLCAFFIFYAQPTILFLSGQDYLNSIPPMQLIMPSMIFIGITGITGIQMMVPLGREKQVLYSEITGAVVNIIVNALLIPRLGASGAAIGTVLAELAVLVVQFCCLKDILPTLIRQVSFGKIGLAMICACAAGFAVRNISAISILQLLVGAAAFFLVYFIMLFIMKEPEVLSLCHTGIKRGKREE